MRLPKALARALRSVRVEEPGHGGAEAGEVGDVGQDGEDPLHCSGRSSRAADRGETMDALSEEPESFYKSYLN